MPHHRAHDAPHYALARVDTQDNPNESENHAPPHPPANPSHPDAASLFPPQSHRAQLQKRVAPPLAHSAPHPAVHTRYAANLNNTPDTSPLDQGSPQNPAPTQYRSARH